MLLYLCDSLSSLPSQSSAAVWAQGIHTGIAGKCARSLTNFFAIMSHTTQQPFPRFMLTAPTMWFEHGNGLSLYSTTINSSNNNHRKSTMFRQNWCIFSFFFKKSSDLFFYSSLILMRSKAQGNVALHCSDRLRNCIDARVRVMGKPVGKAVNLWKWRNANCASPSIAPVIFATD